MIVLGTATGFEGVVRRPDGIPAAGVLVQAVSGPKHMFLLGSRHPIFEHRFETISDDEGRYRIDLQPDEYEIDVCVPGAGSARLSPEPLTIGQLHSLDVYLEPGASFRAKILDSQTRTPVPGIVLRVSRQKGSSNPGARPRVVTATSAYRGAIDGPNSRGNPMRRAKS